MRTLWTDLRYALRQLRRAPGFALTVVLTLALGVGANAIVLSVLNALVLRGLPVPQADRLMFLNRLGNVGSSVASSPTQSYPDYRAFRDRNRSFADIAAYALDRAGVGEAGAVRQSWLTVASENYFDMLRVEPALGRFFHASDAHGPNSMPYAVLSYAYWQGPLHADPHVAGKVLQINKHPFTILGVAPWSFSGTERFFSSDMWVPILNAEQLDGYSYLESWGDHGINVLGRLRPGIGTAQAEADLNAIAVQLGREHQQDDGLRIHLSRPGLLGDLLGKPVRAFLYGVLGLAAMVLLAACANLGSLFAARAADRARETAVRLALGASRMALLRGLVTEAVCVSAIGGAAGLALADAALQALSRWHPSPEYPVRFTVDADWRVGALALLLAVASGIFFGLAPSRQIWREDASLVIKSGAGAAHTPVGGRRWALRDGLLRDHLLFVQIVLCSVLVTASLVAVRGLARSLHTSFGFEPARALLATFDLSMGGYMDETSLPVQKKAADALAALPGVDAVGFADKLPLSLSTSDSNVWRDGTTDFRDSSATTDASRYRVSPGYLRASGTRLRAGRDFTWHDDAHSPQVAVVNQTFARKLFGTPDAVGRFFFLGQGARCQVVGVVADGKYRTLTEDPAAAMFFPFAQSPDSSTIFVVRSRPGAAVSAAAVHKALTGVDPNVPVTLTSWTASLGAALLPSTAATVALGVMGGLAAMLAVTGIFGMASYAVSKRMREFGLRVALGAGRKDVLKAALGRPARLLLYGSVTGLALGALSSRLLALVVYQASSQDPVVLFGVIATMALLALLATWLPARRALQADPATLLREE